METTSEEECASDATSQRAVISCPFQHDIREEPRLTHSRPAYAANVLTESEGAPRYFDRSFGKRPLEGICAR